MNLKLRGVSCRFVIRLALLELNGFALNALFVIPALEDAVHVNRCHVNGIRIKRSRLHQLLYFCYGDPSCFGHRCGEITRGLAENEVAITVTLPRFYNSEISIQC